MNIINLHVGISYPRSIWNILTVKHGEVSQNKSWELNLYRTSTILELTLSWTINCDHAGLECSVGAFGIKLEFIIHDNRHWDYKNNCYIN